jgi:hypothetical protein
MEKRFGREHLDAMTPEQLYLEYKSFKPAK